DAWTGSPGKPRPASRTPPAPAEGDTPRQSVTLEPKGGVARGVLTLPAAPGEGQAYWVQPSYVSLGGPKWAVAQVYQPPPPAQRQRAVQPGTTRPFPLSEPFTLRIREAFDYALRSGLDANLTETARAVDADGKADVRLQYDRLRTGLVHEQEQPAAQGPGHR